jgi:PhoD-like phosphatase, N-terminal domain
VASGDPWHTSVLLWTRAVPIPVALNPLAPPSTIPDQSVPVCVSYAIYPNQHLSGHPTASGQAFTSYDVDFTVKVEASGLKPDTQYWYRFSDCTNPKSTSPIGRTRTFSHPNSWFFYLHLSDSPSLTIFLSSRGKGKWRKAAYVSRLLLLSIPIWSVFDISLSAMTRLSFVQGISMHMGLQLTTLQRMHSSTLVTTCVCPRKSSIVVDHSSRVCRSTRVLGTGGCCSRFAGRVIKTT